MNRSTILLLVVVGGAVLGGCRAAPANRGTMIIGDVVGDNDIKNKEDRLRGRGVQVSDAWLGPRGETFVDTTNREREFILYPVKGDRLGTSHYVVEVRHGVVSTVSKQRQNTVDFEGALKESNLREDLIGKLRDECVAHAGFGEPLIIVRSRDNSEEISIYDVSNLTNLNGARYCVLRFDFEKQCREISLVGDVGSLVIDPVEG